LQPWRVNFPETTENEYGTNTNTGSLRWKTQPPDEGEAEHWYLIEVWNRLKETSQTSNGRVTKYTKTYYPAWFEMKKTKANTKGFKLEVSLPNAAFDSQGGIRGFWHGSGDVWYNVEKQAGAIEAIIEYMWERGYSRPTMTARLTLSAEATGEVEIRAKDGKTTLRKKVSLGAVGHYIKCHDTESIGYYGQFVDGVIGGLRSFSSRMKAYAALDISTITPTRTTETSATSTVSTIAQVYGIYTPENFLWHLALSTQMKTDITSWTVTITDTYTVNGTAYEVVTVSNHQYTEVWTRDYGCGHYTLDGSYDGTVWVNDEMTCHLDNWQLDHVYPDSGDDNPAYLRCWTCDDLYYLEGIAQHPCLTDWSDPQALATTIALREDGKEMLFINSGSNFVGLRDMANGDSINAFYLEANQTVDGKAVQVDGYTYDKFFAIV
jgi:hypothetical protein